MNDLLDAKIKLLATRILIPLICVVAFGILVVHQPSKMASGMFIVALTYLSYFLGSHARRQQEIIESEPSEPI